MVGFALKVTFVKYTLANDSVVTITTANKCGNSMDDNNVIYMINSSMVSVVVTLTRMLT